MLKYLLLIIVVLGSLCDGKTTAVAKEESQNPHHCKQRNGFYPIEGSCDSYIECRDHESQQMLCPDGLHFNPKVKWPAYPCGYSIDVPCKGRGNPQPANPTAECPHQYGFYAAPRASASNCGEYRMCIEGRSTPMECPPGLAFNPALAQCDWPDVIPTCDADSFLGFKCPPGHSDENGQPLEITQNYKYEDNCFAFFSCVRGRARLLSCDAGYAFNPTTGKCEDDAHVHCERRTK